MSAFNKPRLINGKKAGADLTGSIHKAVKLDGNGDIVLAGAGEGIGFLMNAPRSGAFAEVAGLGGGAKAISAATLAAGVFLKSDANGDMVEATTANDIAIAQAMESSVDNDHFEVMPIYLRIHA